MSNPKFNVVTFLDSTINSENSITGFNFTNTLPSPSYPSGYFKNSNAVTIPSSLSAGEQIANTSVTVSKEGAMGMWFNPNGWGLVNTTMSGDTFNTIIGRDNTANPLITWLVINGVGIRMQFNDAVNPTRLVDCTPCTIVYDTWHHAAVAWSTSGDVIKAYLDGVEIGSTSATIALTGSSTTFVSLGCRGTLSDLTSNADLDTLKMYNFFKTDWSDRNDRRAGLNDIIPVQ